MTIGVFNSSQQLATLKKPSFAQLITRLAPNGQSPLFALTSMMKTEVAVQVEHGYFSKTMLFPSATSWATQILAATTTLDVLDTTNLLPNMIMRVDGTDENMIINSILSLTQIQVTRGLGTVAAANIPVSTKLWMVGNAFEESSLRPGALRIDTVANTNYTQIFRNTWAISDTMRNTMNIAGDSNVAENKQDAATFHAADIEKALFFGQKFAGTRNGQPFRTMEGVIANTVANAAGNITTLGATTTLTQLEAAIDPVFNQTTDPSGAGDRVIFVGGKARSVLHQIGRLNGTVQLVDGQTSFGLQFSSFKLARGMVRIIEHPLFNAFGATSTFSKMGVVVDLPTFALAYLGDRKTQHKPFNASTTGEATDNGIDATGGTLTTEVTALFRNPQANAVLYAFTAGAAG